MKDDGESVIPNGFLEQMLANAVSDNPYAKTWFYTPGVDTRSRRRRFVDRLYSRGWSVRWRLARLLYPDVFTDE